jgi:hypothetical protein
MKLNFAREISIYNWKAFRIIMSMKIYVATVRFCNWFCERL